MDYVQWLFGEGVIVMRDNRMWMTWNLMLAAVPVALGFVLFRRPCRRGALWWMGAVAFALTLPNAPYVVTDLIHLDSDIAAAPSDGVVLAVVLPLYAVFVAAGLVAYAVAVAELLSFLRQRFPDISRASILPAVHLISAAGVVLGRVARLNSWDALVTPMSTVRLTAETLTWRGAPAAILIMFLTIWAGHVITCHMARPLIDWRNRVVLAN